MTIRAWNNGTSRAAASSTGTASAMPSPSASSVGIAIFAAASKNFGLRCCCRFIWRGCSCGREARKDVDQEGDTRQTGGAS